MKVAMSALAGEPPKPLHMVVDGMGLKVF